MSCDDYAFATPISLYIGRDNAVTIIPYSNISELTNFDMSQTIRVVANADVVGDETVGNSFEMDSDDPSGAVYWDDNNPEGEWRIYSKVGLFDNPTAIVPGTYTLRITIYDIDHPNGLVLPGTDSNLQIIMIDLP